MKPVRIYIMTYCGYFIGSMHVGGYSDLARLEASGELDQLLEQHGSTA